MILHEDVHFGCSLVEEVSEIDNGRIKCDRIDSEYCEDREFNREDLICSSNLDRNPHGELLILVLWRLFILLD